MMKLIAEGSKREFSKFEGLVVMKDGGRLWATVMDAMWVEGRIAGRYAQGTRIARKWVEELKGEGFITVS